MNEWMILEGLRYGAIFETQDGTRAVKSEYLYSNDPDAQWLCILLSSGEFAHFVDGNKTLVREIVLKEEQHAREDENRVDRQDMESSYRVRRGVSWM